MTSAAGDVSTRWSRSFDIHEDDEAGAIIADGDDLVVFERDSTTWMATLDGLGNPTWQTSRQPRWQRRRRDPHRRGELVTAGAAVGGVRVERFDAAGGSSGPSRSTSTTSRAEPGRRSCPPAAASSSPATSDTRRTNERPRRRRRRRHRAGPPRSTPARCTPTSSSLPPEGAERRPVSSERRCYFPDAAHDDWQAFVMRVDRDGTVCRVRHRWTAHAGDRHRRSARRVLRHQWTDRRDRRRPRSWVAEFAPDDSCCGPPPTSTGRPATRLRARDGHRDRPGRRRLRRVGRHRHGRTAG